MRKILFLTMVLLLAACGDATAPEPPLDPSLLKSPTYMATNPLRETAYRCDIPNHYDGECLQYFAIAMGTTITELGLCVKAARSTGPFAWGKCLTAAGVAAGAWRTWEMTPAADGHRNWSEHEAARLLQLRQQRDREQYEENGGVR